MFDQSISNHLRSDNLLLVNQKKKSAILGNTKSRAYEVFINKHQQHIEKSILLLPEIGQLSHYLQQVPELAWDIVEYAEKSLEVIYPNPRNLPDFLMQKEIPIRVYKEGIFHKFLYNQKNPIVLTLVRDDRNPGKFLNQNEKVLNLPDNYEWKIIADKVMALGLNGEIKFY